MLLTGSEITKAVELGDIVISPFISDCVNPNSYNYHLADHLLYRKESMLPVDPRTSEPRDWEKITIPEAGLILQPNVVYLGATKETIGSFRYVPVLIGRSSMGRLGLFLQISADLGNIGSIHQWTLELVATQPIRVYPGMRIGQVSFWECHGEVVSYSGYFGSITEAAPTPRGYNLK